MPAKAASDNAGAALAMLRKRNTEECQNPECHEVYEGLEVTNYCSNECRFRAAYLRRRDRAEEQEVEHQAQLKARRAKAKHARQGTRQVRAVR